MNLNPKAMIFEAIKSQLKDTEIDSMTFEYKPLIDVFKIYVKSVDGTNFEVEPSNFEKKTVKSMLVSKIINEVKKLNPEKEILKIYIVLKFDTENIDIWYQLVDCKSLFQFNLN